MVCSVCVISWPDSWGNWIDPSDLDHCHIDSCCYTGDPDYECCEIRYGTVIGMPLLFIFIVIAIVLSSCACCPCCPWFGKLPGCKKNASSNAAPIDSIPTEDDQKIVIASYKSGDVYQSEP